MWLLRLLWDTDRVAIWDGPGDDPERPVTWIVERRLVPMEREGGHWTGFGVLPASIVSFEMEVGPTGVLEAFASELVATH